MTREQVKEEFDQLLRRRGRKTSYRSDTPLREIGFRSLDFSELALRIEERVGKELNFDAAVLRNVHTAGDVFDFFELAQRNEADDPDGIERASQ